MKTDAPFKLDLTLDSKAEVSEADDGSVWIEGYASDFGLDRQNEAFEPNAFKAGMKNFMKNPVILYHHKMDEAMGQITEFEERPEGLWIKGRLDPAEPGTEAANRLRKVKSRTLRGMSVGGVFHRRKGPDGKTRIHRADLLEISITPTPVNGRSLLAVVGKAFGDEELEADDAKSVDLSPMMERLERVANVFSKVGEVMEAKADLSAAGRRKSAKSGHAMPDGSYPIENVKDLENAIQAYGRAKNKAAVKRHIIKRAKALGRTDLLPDGWLS